MMTIPSKFTMIEDQHRGVAQYSHPHTVSDADTGAAGDGTDADGDAGAGAPPRSAGGAGAPAGVSHAPPRHGSTGAVSDQERMALRKRHRDALGGSMHSRNPSSDTHGSGAS